MPGKLIVPDKEFLPFWCGFVHAMQYYYAAWSMYYDGSQQVDLVGVHGTESSREYPCTRPVLWCSAHPYVTGFIHHVKKLSSQIKFRNVDVAAALKSDDCEEISRAKLRGWFQSVESACALRDRIFPPSAPGEALSIGIVNRTLERGTNYAKSYREKHENRRITNAGELQTALAARFSTQVDVCTFDEFTFREQAAFCNAHNVMVSSHGSQLCSIPFTPDYSLVVELCHPDYYVDHYFTRLADSSGKSHYMSCSTHDRRCHNPFHSGKGKCRSRDIVCDVGAIVEAVAEFAAFRTRNIEADAPHNRESKKIG
jgi:hypothetical protein